MTPNPNTPTHSPGCRPDSSTAALAVALLLAVLPLPDRATAQTHSADRESTDPVSAAFAGHDPDSTLSLDHGLWSDLLGKSVMHAGYSTRRLGRGVERTWPGSRMGYGNVSPARYENNRVLLHGFGDAHFEQLARYRGALEAVPDQLPLDRLNRAEQLAFWLNLYNAHALEHVARHYPATTTEALRSPPGRPGADVWHEPTLTVAGVRLSLVDIEQKILFPIWNDPRVLYGLWQGAIGGPRLPLKAYTGDTVWSMLEQNADEFINSNRGMQPAGRTLEVSLLYGWGAALFAGEQELIEHIAAYARPPFADGMDSLRRVSVERYDWHLADLSGGTHHQGQWNTMAALVFGLPNGDSRANQFLNQMIRKDDTRETLPPMTVDLIANMQRFNVRTRRVEVRIRNCPDGDECDVGSTDASGGDDSPDDPGA